MGEPIATVGYLAGLCGRIAGVWRKQPLIWGFSDSVSQTIIDLNLAVDEDTVVTVPVEEGEVHVVSAISFRVDSATCDRAELLIVVKGVALLVYSISPPVTFTWYLKTGEFVLTEDDYIALTMTDLTAGDDAYLRYAGYRMDVDL